IFVLSEQEKGFIISFVEGLGFKTSTNYVTDFFEVGEDIEFDCLKNKGLLELMKQINKKCNSAIAISNILSFNNIK
ncbi:TPA: hypothetical protein IP987_002871, partial [Listeria monocytogenes]|nr:hypothetical protein [Listeria monocytogenes]